MSICRYCGGEIEFRYVDGRNTPIHMSGGCFQSDITRLKNPNEYSFTDMWNSQSDVATSNVIGVNSFTDICRQTKCPKCGEAVFFIRHNGGSVWLDGLGYPWPKHPCFETEATPSWFDYIKRQTYTSESEELLLGTIVRAERVHKDTIGPSRIIIAVDGGSERRICIATSGDNTADYLLGQIVIVNAKREQVITSKHEIRPILRILVHPAELGLPDNWTSSITAI